MKILLTGLLPASVMEIGVRLTREGHQVSVLGQGLKGRGLMADGIAVHDDHFTQNELHKFMEAARFQAVVFFYAHQCEDLHEYSLVQGALLDDLFAIQNAATNGGVEYLVLITDQRVFGKVQSGSESESPYPDTQTGVLIKAAEDCLRCCVRDGFQTLLIRVTSLYAADDPGSFFSHAANCARKKETLRLKGTPETHCDFLHADDLALFISLALEARLTGAIHLAHGVIHSYGEVAAILKEHFPGLNVGFSDEAERCDALQIRGAKAVKWVPRHDFVKELDGLIDSPVSGKRLNPLGWIGKQVRSSMGKSLPWVELILLGAAAWWLSQASKTNASIRYVDFWLLYVTIMGTMHGGMMGTLAALVAFAAYATGWLQGGNELYLLLYNIDNWLAPVSYLLAGALFGYVRDNQRERMETLEAEKRARDNEAEFMKSMYDQAHEDRNKLLEQVLRYRDSYGRIYQITRELDTMQPEQVFLSTLNVVEDTLQNQSVAIYARKGNLPFARLVVHSRSMQNLSRSLDMEKLPKLRDSLNEGKLFINKSLEPGYPAFAAPISDEKEPLAAIMLWDVPFDKQTLYFENLFNVVAGLVQSAMVRALKYFNLSGDVFLENTRILADHAFLSALGVYQNMRKQRTGRFLMVRLHGDVGLSVEEYDRRIGKAIRSTDLAGRLADGAYYVLFPQAGTDNLPQISARFIAQGLQCEVVPQEANYV